MRELLLMGGFWGVLLGTGSALWLFYSGFIAPRRHLHQRAMTLHQLVGSGESAASEATREKRRLIQQKLKELEKENRKKRGAVIHRMLASAGSSLSVRIYCVLSLLLGLAVAAGLYIFGFSPYVTGAGGAAAGLFLPRFYFKTRITLRQKRFTAAFPDALELIIRAVKSGLPVIEGLRMISREFSDPIAGEFRRIVDSQKLGMTLAESLDQARERIATPEFKYFSVVLDIQQRTGGNLSQTLSNLSNVLRGRAHLQDRIGALSSEARSSAMIIGALPFVVTGLLYVLDPNYMSVMFTNETGNLLIMGCLGWMGLGMLLMKQMMKIKP